MQSAGLGFKNSDADNQRPASCAGTFIIGINGLWLRSGSDRLGIPVSNQSS
jgi:hypothetical protein